MAKNERVIISVENTCDLPEEMLKDLDVKFIKLNYRNETTGEENPNLTLAEFYQKEKEGNVFKTSLANTFEFEEYFKPLVENGDVVHIGLSSGLSSNFKSVKEAADNLNQKSENHIYVIDSLTGSLGQAFILKEVCKKRDQGASAKEISLFAEDLKMHLVTNFMLEDLKTASRSGRFSKVAAFLASVLNVKPILYVNDVGAFSCAKKVFGRKGALKSLVEIFKEKYDGKYKRVIIMHSDAQKDAEAVKNEILSDPKYKDLEIEIYWLGTVIGSHCGPGVVTLAYSSASRN